MNAKKLKVITDNTLNHRGAILSLKMIQDYAQRVHGVLIHCVDSSQCSEEEAVDYTEFEDTITLINPEPSEIMEALKTTKLELEFMVCYFG